MPIAPANGIEIFYDEFGRASDPALLLIRGFGSQMISWHEDFCEQLAGHNLRVIRFDNRDTGLSTKFAEGSKYTLDDMAADGIGLLDHLGIAAAHVFGISMGGMIAQLMAINHPGRVKSLASGMSAMSERDAVPPTPEVAARFVAPAGDTREQVIENEVEVRRVIGSRGPWFDEDEIRAMAAASYDRCYCPQGRIRQMLAIGAARPRKAALSAVTIPVLVLHGADDPIVPVENGRRTAEAIGGAELVIIDGMGHDLPRGAWDRIVDAIVSNIKRAG